MTNQTDTAGGRDYKKTLFLPKTAFPMKAGLPKKEPEIIAHWDRINLYQRLRDASRGRAKYTLHDGPPYANGHLHIGHALNKILKDVVTRSLQMAGYDSNYVPGWDCHGLPIEWKIEEQYRAKGKNKDEVTINEFRRECREFAEHWIKVQTEEFRRLGVEGDFTDPYLTMTFAAEAAIAREVMKFADSGQLYRGSKPVMWSVVERTALAEAEVEYHDYESDTIWAKFPVKYLRGGTGPTWGGIANPDDAMVRVFPGDFVLIWTTTPWTIPGNRAISYSRSVSYGRYEVDSAENAFGPQPGEFVILANSLAQSCEEKAKVKLNKLYDIPWEVVGGIRCHHPLHSLGYTFDVPLLAGDHVTDAEGTGFVHTAPGHGREDFEAWMDNARELRERGIDTAIPFTVDDAGFFTKEAPGFEGRRVIDDKGKKGDANKAVIDELIKANMLFARGRLKHQYPHSWRSKKPVIFRNTPQWFIHMDMALEGGPDDTLRNRALAAIDATRFVPQTGQNRLRGMIEAKPDWVLSRQRAWGVPIAVFVDESGEVLNDPAVNDRIESVFQEEGADAWFKDGAKERFLGNDHDHGRWSKVDDILDVWFESGSTHAFVMEQRPDLISNRIVDGGQDRVIYLEGSDQHRGWFHSSLLESCGTRGRAPYDEVVTHGFVMDEDGHKMSKSMGNIVAPQDVIKQSGADILRLWVATADYAEDLRIGPEIIKTNVDAYRKLRNTIRWMLGSLAHHDGRAVDLSDMPELERLMLHRLVELNDVVRRGYDNYDYKRIAATLMNFMTVELSAFYFDVRKDALYCDPISSTKRRAALTVIASLFDHLTVWWAPLLPFTMEEAWQARYGNPDGSIHLETFPALPADLLHDALASKWADIRMARRVVTGALEVERREKRIGSSLESAPIVHVDDAALKATLDSVDFAEICITSQIEVQATGAPAEAFRLEDVAGVAVVPKPAEGNKCARSWRISPDVGSDPEWPDISARDAMAMREWEASGAEAAE